MTCEHCVLHQPTRRPQSHAVGACRQKECEDARYVEICCRKDRLNPAPGACEHTKAFRHQRKLIMIGSRCTAWPARPSHPAHCGALRALMCRASQTRSWQGRQASGTDALSDEILMWVSRSTAGISSVGRAKAAGPPCRRHPADASTRQTLLPPYVARTPASGSAKT